ncbi:MAG TPA: restriction endonuclease [Candidatus Dormibacteraeota bacterium]|jgi:restriction system protein
MAVVLRKPPDPDLWRSAHAGEDVYEMNGVTFEDLISVALSEYGYRDIQLTEYYDQGADLVARRNGQLISIQVKRWEQRVDEAAVAQAVQGKAAYRCAAAMVITNSIFTHEARRVAKLRGVILWDQDDLANLLHTTNIATRTRTTAPNCLTCGLPMTLLWQPRPSWGCSNDRPCAERVRYRKWVLKVSAHAPDRTAAVAASALGSPPSPPPPPPPVWPVWHTPVARSAPRRPIRSPGTELKHGVALIAVVVGWLCVAGLVAALLAAPAAGNQNQRGGYLVAFCLFGLPTTWGTLALRKARRGRS